MSREFFIWFKLHSGFILWSALPRFLKPSPNVVGADADLTQAPTFDFQTILSFAVSAGDLAEPVLP